MKIKTALEVAAGARLHPPRSADAVRDTRGRFLAGTAPGPGKPLGGRGRLAAALIDDLLREWPRSGRAAIRKLAREHPSTYLRLMARIAMRLRKPSD